MDIHRSPKSRRLTFWIAVFLAASAASTVARGDDPSSSDKLDALLDRFQKLEETNRRLTEKVDQLSTENSKLSQEVRDLSRQVKQPAADAKPKAKAKPADSGIAGQGGWEKAIEHDRKARDAAAAPLEDLDDAISGGVQEQEPQGVGNRYLGKLPLKSYYNYTKMGIGLATEDDELELKMRVELQVDNYTFPGGAQEYIHGGTYLPRTRFYFQGHFTKPVEYQISFQRGLTSFGLLNGFLDFNYDKRLQFRVGRFKVPYTYEWYKLNNWRFITPERSLFSANFGLNRMNALMGHGLLFDDRAEYAVAVGSGPRNSDVDYNARKDVVALLNFRPFLLTDGALKNLNVGGSMDYGMQDNPAQPAVLRSNGNASGNAVGSDSGADLVGIPFLAFNKDVVERGKRELWELHLAYFYQGLSVIATWDAGVDSYAKKAGGPPVPLAVNGWSVEASYFLTGETLSERTVVDPIHRFDLRPGKFGIGAIEPFARYSALGVSNDVFTQGLADPNLWTSRIGMTDVGFNWYLNHATKLYFDWQHSMYAQPVFYRAGGLRSTADILWLRFQFMY